MTFKKQLEKCLVFLMLHKSKFECYLIRRQFFRALEKNQNSFFWYF